MIDVIDLIARTAPEIEGPSPEETIAARCALLDHAARTTRSRTGDRRRRIRWAGGLVAATSIAGAGAVAAAGLVPDSVRHRFGVFDKSNSSMQPILERASMIATATAPTGAIFELWQAPSAGGGRCEYARVRVTSGSEDGGVSCSANPDMLGTAADLYVASVPMRPDPNTAVYGQAPPGSASVSITFSNGSVASAPVESGWYVTTVPFTLDGGPGSASIASVVARDSAGNVIRREVGNN